MNLLDLFEGKFKLDIVDPVIIAEAGVNHEGDIELAKRLISEAKEGGADAIKFQSYKANTIAIKYSPAYWDLSKESTRTQYDLFKKYDKFWKKEFEFLKKYCDDCDIEFLSTPFDLESAKFLNDLVNVFKISSSDITNKPFIEFICDFNKPIILSTGASFLHEIQEAVDWIDLKGNQLSLLHCILNYPTNDENANLGMLLNLQTKFPDKIIGYSDHTLPKDMKVLEIAVLLGAKIIEKHFTFDKTLPGNDHYHSMDVNDLIKFKKMLERNRIIIGSYKKKSIESEEKPRLNARRSLVVNRDIFKGSIVTKDDLTWKRPAIGISPKYIDFVIGKKVIKDILEDNPIQFNDLDK